jgi:hypothetical protein
MSYAANWEQQGKERDTYVGHFEAVWCLVPDLHKKLIRCGVVCPRCSCTALKDWSRFATAVKPNLKVGRTPACVKTCNSQDTMSETWRKERSTVETNEIMKTAAHRSESWWWRQLLFLLSHVLMLVLTQLVCGRPKTAAAAVCCTMCPHILSR